MILSIKFSSLYSPKIRQIDNQIFLSKEALRKEEILHNLGPNFCTRQVQAHSNLRPNFISFSQLCRNPASCVVPPSSPPHREATMAMAAALARAATRLLRGGLPPAASATSAVPALSPRIHRQLCGLPAADEPSAAGEADPWEEAEAEILRNVKPTVELVKDILHTSRSASVPGHFS